MSDIRLFLRDAPITRESDAWAVEFFASLGPLINWKIYATPYMHARKIGDNVTVIFSAQREADGRRWVHVSLSRPSRLPSWDDVREVKDAFIGRGRKALQILPPQSEYVNIHPHCLHLWHCLDGDGLPDFRIEGRATLEDLGTAPPEQDAHHQEPAEEHDLPDARHLGVARQGEHQQAHQRNQQHHP